MKKINKFVRLFPAIRLNYPHNTTWLYLLGKLKGAYAPKNYILNFYFTLNKIALCAPPGQPPDARLSPGQTRIIARRNEGSTNNDQKAA